MSELFGAFDENIKMLEKEYCVSITSHNETIKIRGEEGDVSLASKAIDALIVLIKKGESIKEISEQLSFSSPNYFTAVFKKEMGILPTKYRNKKS